MAFKLPSTNWQGPKGFRACEGRCCVCSSAHDLGLHPEHLYVACRRHASCQPCAVSLVCSCLADGSRIPKRVFDAGRWNSYDQDMMLPHLSDELLVELTALTLKNCSPTQTPAATYDEALQLYARELAARLDKGRDGMLRLARASARLLAELGSCACSAAHTQRGLVDPACVVCDNKAEIQAVLDALPDLREAGE